MDFPYSEFQGLVFRTLEVLEEAKEDTVIQETGKKLLATLYSRIVGTDNLELKQRVDTILGTQNAPSPANPGSLRNLVKYLSKESGDRPIYVIKRTDRLGATRDLQKTVLLAHFPECVQLWFAPERFGQKTPAMAFLAFPPDFFMQEGEISIENKTLYSSLFKPNDY